MKKRVCKFLGIFIALVMLLVTPAPLLGTGLAAVLAASEDFHQTAPEQASTPFTSEYLDNYDIYAWDNDKSPNTVISQITSANDIDNFYRQNPNAWKIPASEIGDSKVVMLNASHQDYKVNAHYTSPEINLTANSYFKISVSYYAMGAASHFYLGDESITLGQLQSWQTSTFYVHTDSLEAATLTAELYLGDRDNYIEGAIFYRDFNAEAIREQDYNKAVANLTANERKVDLTQTDEIRPLETFTNANFKKVLEAGATSETAVNSTQVPRELKFEDHDYFYTRSGTVEDVMLLAAENAYAEITLDKDLYTFNPLPNQVYMFQFYSISANTTTNFYFKVGDTYHQVTTLTYPYRNGWQLNTFFYIGAITAGKAEDQDFTLSFTIGTTEEAATGWACIDGLQIALVSSAYAEANASAVGVHDTCDLNADETEDTTQNFNFNHGTTSSLSLPSYPYPLQAAGEWETDGAYNGIVNTAYWTGIGENNPGRISAYYKENNNIYMMRNVENTTNTLTSPGITLTAGTTTYISFDAYGTLASQTSVVLLADNIEIGHMDINHGAWRHYEFVVTESEFAASRTYNLQFIMQKTGASYLDHINVTTTPTTSGTVTTKVIDLASSVAFAGVWERDANQAQIVTDADGVLLTNVNQATTTVQNTLAYTLTEDSYYKLSVTATGENAFLQVSGFDGYLEVTRNEIDANELQGYTLYFRANADTTTINFMVMLGSQETDEFVDAKIYLGSLTLESIEDVDYELAKRQQSSDSTIKVLSSATQSDDTDDEEDTSSSGNFFSENWWYLVPTLITALAVLLAVISFLMRKFKFDTHITRKTTSYARDVKLRDSKKKIVAEQTAKIDNIEDDNKKNN